MMLGAAATVADYNGVAKASHIKDGVGFRKGFNGGDHGMIWRFPARKMGGIPLSLDCFLVEKPKKNGYDLGVPYYFWKPSCADFATIDH